VELPGHGARWREGLFTNFPALVDSIYSELRFWVEKPFIFFGHSMGNFLCFEAARRLRREGLPQPLHLLVASSHAPQMPHRTEPISDLPYDEFVERLRTLNGTPPEVLENPEILQIFAPVIRADLALCETYRYEEERPLSCPISAFGGWEDPEATSEELAEWNEQTRHGFSLHMFHASHFFLRSAEDEFLEVLSRKIQFIAEAVLETSSSEVPCERPHRIFGLSKP